MPAATLNIIGSRVCPIPRKTAHTVTVMIWLKKPAEIMRKYRVASAAISLLAPSRRISCGASSTPADGQQYADSPMMGRLTREVRRHGGVVPRAAALGDHPP